MLVHNPRLTMPEDKERKRKRAAAKGMSNRKRADRYKVEQGCCDCGYNVHPAALEFDHINPDTKTRNVAGMMNGSWERIEREINKCEVRCANCHQIKSVMERKEHYEYRRNNR